MGNRARFFAVLLVFACSGLQADDLFDPIATVVMHPRCINCHQATNTADGFVPGVATWRLAPLSMLWEGRTKRQICQQMKDPARNGGRRTGEQIIEHMKSDPLVLWAWSPGAGRKTPPLSHDQFVAALEQWIQADMPCPSD